MLYKAFHHKDKSIASLLGYFVYKSSEYSSYRYKFLKFNHAEFENLSRSAELLCYHLNYF